MSHTKHQAIARTLSARLGISYQQALDHVRAGRDRELLSLTPDTVLYVCGFVTDGAVGGFEWSLDRAVVQAFHDEWVADGDCDVSDVQTVAVSDLPLDFAGDLLSTPDALTAAVTDALDACPEMWEPAVGQNRPDPAGGGSRVCNPGHPDAIAAGCRCDPAKNRYGAYTADGGVQPWIVSSGCPVHGLVVGWTARSAKPTN